MRIRDLIEALRIIEKTQPDTSVDIHNDTLYAGEVRPDMAPEDAHRLAELGWDEDEDSWAVST